MAGVHWGVAMAMMPEVTTQPVELGLFFLIGILGAAHCLGMCGPLVSIYSDRLGANRTESAPDGGTVNDGGTVAASAPGATDRVGTWHLFKQHALFNLGRVAIYALLGGVFGLVGGAMMVTVDVTVPFGEGVRGVAGVVAGLAIVLAGLGFVFGWKSRVLAGELPLLRPAFTRVYHVLMSHVDDWVGGPRIFALGFIHGFLPCPLLYPAFIYAFGRGDPVHGALALGLLGLGTFPAVFLYGALYQFADIDSRPFAHRIFGVAFVLLGLHTVLMGLMALGVPVPMLGIPVYQPLFGAASGEIPLVLVVSVAGLESLLLLGLGLVALNQRRTRSYFLIALALLAFSGRVILEVLMVLGFVPDGAHRLAEYSSTPRWPRSSSPPSTTPAPRSRTSTTPEGF
ncbi:sulfite exporter TauE/SafE family protein [Halobacteriaceae archaeon GCM10025711]